MLRVGILIASDRAFSGEYVDLGGPSLAKYCGDQGWIVEVPRICPDEVGPICEVLREWVMEFDLILISGGTGAGPRDVTPEAVGSLADRVLPGFGEVMRAKASTPFSILSRCAAYVMGEVLVLTLPGKPAGAVESVEAVAFVIPHVIDQIRGGRH